MKGQGLKKNNLKLIDTFYINPFLFHVDNG